MFRAFIIFAGHRPPNDENTRIFHGKSSAGKKLMLSVVLHAT